MGDESTDVSIVRWLTIVVREITMRRRTRSFQSSVDFIPLIEDTAKGIVEARINALRALD